MSGTPSGAGPAGGSSGQAGASSAGGSSGQAGAPGMGGAAGSTGESGQTGGGPGSDGGAGGTSGAFGLIHLVPNVIAGVQAPAVKASDLTVVQSPIRIGSPAATNLRSLKYFITSIQLCQNVVQAGSGYSSAEGCINLYQGPLDAPALYPSYLVAQAEADTTPGHFIDLMTAEGQAALRQPVTLQVPIADLPAGPDGGAGDGGTVDGGAVDADDAGAHPADIDVDAGSNDGAPRDDAGGSAPVDGGALDGPVSAPPSQAGVYRYGLINFMRPIKVTAEFPILGQPGQYFRTRAVTHITSTSAAGGYAYDRVQIGDTLSGPTEETTYMLNNGGALFTFQKPFVITRADVEAGAPIKIDLVFNPDSFGQAYEVMGCVDQPYAAICDPANDVFIDMPFVHMNPVPRKAGEKTRKETYLMDYEPGTQLRIELYYNDGDPEAGIQGIDTAIVYSSSASNPVNNVIASNYVSQTGSVTTHDASVTLMDYQHTPNLTGLLRRQSGTATVNCVFTGSLCPTVGTTTTRPYIYFSDTIVSSD